MDFSAFKDWVMLGLLGGLVYVIWEAKNVIAVKLDSLDTSVKILNIQVAVVIEKTTNHEKRIEKLEEGV